FNYFNRFNNALHVEITLTDPDVIVRRVEEAAEATKDVQELCDRVADILYQGRRYVRVGLYRRDKDRLVLLAWRGSAAPPASVRLREGALGATRHGGAVRDGGFVVPVLADGSVVGSVEVECDRPAAIDEEDRPLVERVASVLAARLA